MMGESDIHILSGMARLAVAPRVLRSLAGRPHYGMYEFLALSGRHNRIATHGATVCAGQTR